MEMSDRRRKVFVAMSGGVDSSVAAALLKQAGHKVTGVFIHGWEPTRFAKVNSGQAPIACDWRAERRTALRAAATLDLPLLTVDASKEYETLIVEPMIADYRAGRTPNPDVLCNRLIKFDFLWRFAQVHGAAMLATGHYARMKRDNDSLKRDSDFPAPGQRGEVAIKSLPRLLVSADKEKDQTYFLWTLTQDDLAHTLFPIGDYRKTKVRELAKHFCLPNAAKPDSQGLCFVGPLNFKTFLRSYLPLKFGPVQDEEGREIGEHDGTHFYTIGERHGFRVTAQTPNTPPLYVITKDVMKNILIVAAKPSISAEVKKEILRDRINWISGTPTPTQASKLKARIRYRASLVDCQVENLRDHTARVAFTQALFGATAGQSCVFYDSTGTVCLGGGVIVEG